jgi:subtilisin-like proprotein convertase family protein
VVVQARCRHETTSVSSALLSRSVHAQGERMKFETGCVVFVLSCVLTPHEAHGQAIMATTPEGTVGVVFPTPSAGFPTPAQVDIAGFPADARPHGVDYFGDDFALLSDFAGSRIVVAQVSTRTVLDVIDTAPAGYSGTGTIAVNPSGTFALASSGNGTLHVIGAPFQATSPISAVSLPGTHHQAQTCTVAFDSSGRAYVLNSTGVSVLDSPYDTIAFTIPGSFPDGGCLDLAPDGSQILTTNLANTVSIYSAPYSTSSTAVSLAIPAASGISGIDGIRVTPDGSRALVVAAFTPKIFSIAAPFDAASTVEEIPLPESLAGASMPGFEDLDISADGMLAIVTGNSDGSLAPAAFILAPFTAASAVVHAVDVLGGGRGAGAVRFRRTIATPSAYLIPQTPAPSQISGDGDSVIEPGEGWALTIPLLNAGDDDATAITATLSALSSGVTVDQASSAYPDLPQASHGDNQSAYVLTVDAGVPCGSSLELSLTVTFTGGVSGSVTYTIELPIGAASSPLVFEYTGAPVAIPDASGVPGVVSLPVSGVPGPLADVDFSFGGTVCSSDDGSTTVGLDHTFIDDVEVLVRSPLGTAVKVVNRVDWDGNNLCRVYLDDDTTNPSIDGVTSSQAPFTGTWKPSEALSAFDGESANGTWQVEGRDFVGADEGSLRSVALHLRATVCSSTPEPCIDGDDGLCFHTVVPCRVIDTRSGPAPVSGSELAILAAGLCGVPLDARAVAVNVTAAGSTGNGNLVAYPVSGALTSSSIINFAAGLTRANNQVIALESGETGGRFFVRPTVAGGGTVHVIVDVTGYFID